ncbi:MAG: response regulator [Desulfobacteraceae bacterium]
MHHQILIIDEEASLTEQLQHAFSREPIVILSAPSPSEALNILTFEPVDLVVLDEKTPGVASSEFLPVVRRKYVDTLLIILTGHSRQTAAVRAMCLGKIYRFFCAPYDVLDLVTTIRQALHQKALMKESRRLLKVVKHQSEFIKAMESKYPAIKHTPRKIPADDEIDDGTFEGLMNRIGHVLKNCGATFHEDPIILFGVYVK